MRKETRMKLCNKLYTTFSGQREFSKQYCEVGGQVMHDTVCRVVHNILGDIVETNLSDVVINVILDLAAERSIGSY